MAQVMFGYTAFPSWLFHRLFNLTSQVQHTTNYIFVTGGVVSSLGKGIAAASLAAILEARGLNVTIMKLDPYSTSIQVL